MPSRRAMTFALLAIVLVAPVVSAGEIRAIWIWEESTFRMLDDPGWRDGILEKLQSDGFNTLYLYADAWKGRNPIESETEACETLIRKSHEAGFRVEALLGSAYLETNQYVLPDKRDAARRMIGRVIAYNTGRQSDARFDAIHLDIEPYTLPEWKSDRSAVAELFVEAAAEWAALAHDDDSRIEIGAAIPFWFDGVERERGSLADALIHTFDYVALMDYRDKAEGGDGIIEHARDEIDAAARLGGRVIVGVDTGKGDLDKLTFAEEGRDVMERELKKVIDEYRNAEAFDGVAIHHLDSYLRLK